MEKKEKMGKNLKKRKKEAKKRKKRRSKQAKNLTDKRESRDFQYPPPSEGSSGGSPQRTHTQGEGGSEGPPRGEGYPKGTPVLGVKGFGGTPKPPRTTL